MSQFTNAPTLTDNAGDNITFCARDVELSETFQFVTGSGATVWCEPEDAAAFARAILEMVGEE